MSRLSRPALLVAIDTEGDNQWSAAARANQTFENIYALDRLHELFARHGVRPTYVVTYPVAADPRSAAMLRGLAAGGDCEIGAHRSRDRWCWAGSVVCLSTPVASGSCIRWWFAGPIDDKASDARWRRPSRLRPAGAAD
jgi:hypothetical protein